VTPSMPRLGTHLGQDAGGAAAYGVRRAGDPLFVKETVSNLGASQPLARAADRAALRVDGMGQGRHELPALFSPQF
jgi:hypothetical protein